MADVPITYTYPSGAPFDVDLHNQQISAIQTATNGHIDHRNMRSAFTVNENLVMREQAVLGRQDFALDTVTYMADAIGSETDPATVTDPSAYRTVAGSGLRWYQPYDVTIAMLQWSFFCSTNTWQIRNHSRNRHTGEGHLSFNYDTLFACFVDGVEIISTRRAPPRSCVYPASKVSSSYKDGWRPSKRWVQTEAHKALQWDQHVMLRPGGVAPSGSSVGLEKGWHELYVAIRMERPRKNTGVFENVRTSFANSWRTHNLVINNKASFGIRNARVVTFL